MYTTHTVTAAANGRVLYSLADSPKERLQSGYVKNVEVIRAREAPDRKVGEAYCNAVASALRMFLCVARYVARAADVETAHAHP
jgi:hypothetical protein